MSDKKFLEKRDLSKVQKSVRLARTDSGADIATFIAAAKMAPAPGTGRLILALDATMSRQPTWDMACKLQGDMFSAASRKAGLAIQLVYFRGMGESRASRFVTETVELARLMSGVTCAGGLTQIGKIFSHALKEHAKARVSAVVFIGDAMEEEIDAIAVLAGQMGLKGIPAFLFQEGSDPTVERAFKEFARLSNGAWFRFDQSSASRLAELLNAIAVYATGGQSALMSHRTQGAKLLLDHLGNGQR